MSGAPGSKGEREYGMVEGKVKKSEKGKLEEGISGVEWSGRTELG